MSKKVSIYLDTSILSALFQKPKERANLTAVFLRRIARRSKLFVSALVKEEIEATPFPEHRKLLSQTAARFPALSLSAEAEALAQDYLRRLRIPEADALHIAVATIEGMDYFLTWNMKHLAREHTREVVDTVNLSKGLHRPYIATPKDFSQKGA